MKKQEKLFRLLDFLNEDVSDVGALRKNLESSGINMHRIDEEVASILKDVDRTIKRKQLDQAREQRSSFGDALKEIARLTFGFSSRRELVDAILAGKFGATARGRLQVQFRNRNPEELSDGDLKALLEDQAILELLEKNTGKKE